MVSEAKNEWLNSLKDKYAFENLKKLSIVSAKVFMYLMWFFVYEIPQEQNDASESQEVTIVEPRRVRNIRRSLFDRGEGKNIFKICLH